MCRSRSLSGTLVPIQGGVPLAKALRRTRRRMGPRLSSESGRARATSALCESLAPGPCVFCSSEDPGHLLSPRLVQVSSQVGWDLGTTGGEKPC